MIGIHLLRTANIFYYHKHCNGVQLFRKRLKLETMKEALRNHVLMVGRIGIADKINSTDGVNQDSKFFIDMEASKTINGCVH